MGVTGLNQAANIASPSSAEWPPMDRWGSAAPTYPAIVGSAAASGPAIGPHSGTCTGAPARRPAPGW